MSCFRIRNSVLFYWPNIWPQRLFPKWNWNSPKFILLIGVLVVICNPFFYLDFALFSSCFQHNIIIFLNARLSFSSASGWRQNINPNQMLSHFVSKSTKLSRTKWGTKFSTVANIRKCCVSIRCQLCFQGVLMVAMPEIRVSWQCCFLSYDFLSNLAYRAALSMSDWTRRSRASEINFCVVTLLI